LDGQGPILAREKFVIEKSVPPSPIMLQELTLASIVHRCARECERFYRRLANDPRYCFELFRRAVVEQSQLAWRYIYSQYGPLVSGWVRRHRAFAESNEDVGYFVNRSFERFWQAVTPDKFSRYPSLKSLLAYLQLCVHSVIVDHHRRQLPPGAELPLDIDGWSHGYDPAIEKDTLNTIRGEALWVEIEKRLKNEKEKVVIESTFVMGMKAGDILAGFPGQFRDAKEVYLIKQNVMARLKRDEQLKSLFA
jgi:hypothetical protein